MAFNVDTFRSKGLIHGGARPALFEVHLTFPTPVVPNGGSITEQTRFVCRAASIPPTGIDRLDVPYMGRRNPIPGDRTQFPDWNITIMQDTDFRIRSAFESWLNGINAHQSNRQNEQLTFTEGQNSLMTTATVYQLARSGNGGNEFEQHLRAYSFVGMWPTAVDSIQLDWEAQDQFEQFNVSLAYWYWIPVVGSGPGSTAVNYPTELNPA